MAARKRVSGENDDNDNDDVTSGIPFPSMIENEGIKREEFYY